MLIEVLREDPPVLTPPALAGRVVANPRSLTGGVTLARALQKLDNNGYEGLGHQRRPMLAITVIQVAKCADSVIRPQSLSTKPLFVTLFSGPFHTQKNGAGMSYCNDEVSASRHPNWLIALVALAIALLSMAWLFAQDARAEEVAEPFCGGTTLGPLNPKGGDKCFSPGQWLTSVWGEGELAICVNGWINGGPASNWNCGPALTYVTIGFNGTRFMNGVIRNNNESRNNLIWNGWYWHNQ